MQIYIGYKLIGLLIIKFNSISELLHCCSPSQFKSLSPCCSSNTPGVTLDLYACSLLCYSVKQVIGQVSHLLSVFPLTVRVRPLTLFIVSRIIFPLDSLFLLPCFHFYVYHRMYFLIILCGTLPDLPLSSLWNIYAPCICVLCFTDTSQYRTMIDM